MALLTFDPKRPQADSPRSMSVGAWNRGLEAVRGRLTRLGITASPRLMDRLSRLDAPQLQIIEVMIIATARENFPVIESIEPTVAAFERGVRGVLRGSAAQSIESKLARIRRTRPISAEVIENMIDRTIAHCDADEKGGA